jgi:hypothetical protein
VDAVAASVPVDPQHARLRSEVQRLHAAARQVSAAVPPEQLEAAVDVVRAAREALERMLAPDERL